MGEVILETLYKSIATFITAGLGIQAILEANNSSTLSRGNKFKIAAIILSAIATIGVDYNSNDSNRQSKIESDSAKINLNKKVTGLKDQNDSLRLTINKGTDTLAQRIRSVRDSSAKMIHGLERDNLALSRQLSKSSIEINKRIVGDGLLVFYLFGTKTNPNYYYGGLKSLSDYTLYDLLLLVTDVDSLRGCKNIIKGNNVHLDGQCYYKHSVEVTPPNLYPHNLVFNKYGITTKNDIKTLEIKITTRHIALLQQAVIYLKGGPGQCLMTYRLYKVGPKLTLLKSENPLGIKEADWKKLFLPVSNRIVEFENI